MGQAVAEIELVTRLDRYFRSALDHPTWRDWRDHARKCFEYKEGEQWTAAEKAELQRRHQPDTVNNQIKVTIDRMVGQFVQTRTRVGYRGRNAPVDEDTANVLTDIFRFIRQNNDLEFEERDVAENGFTCGFGVFSVDATFNDLLEPEIQVRSEDPFTIFPDPWSRRYDWNEDATFICRAKWLDFDEARELYPAKADQLSGLQHETLAVASIDQFKGDSYIDYDNDGRPRRVRVVETWYKEKSRETLELPDGRKIERITPTMKVAVHTGGLLLEQSTDPHHSPLFPFVPYFVQRRANGEPYAPIWTAIPMQDAINKRESKAIHLLNTNQAIVGQQAVSDKNELAVEMAKPDGIIEVRNIEQFRLEKNIDLAQTQMAMHQEAKADFRRITGINPDAMGERSEVRSGVGIARKQAMTDVILSPVFDNFRRTRAILARVLHKMVARYYDEPKVFSITDSLGATRAVAVGDRHILAIKQGIYDVVVEDMPDTTTLQQEQAQMFLQVFPALMQLGPTIARIALKMTDLRDKPELDKMLEQLGQAPPPEPKISLSLEWGKLTAEEKVAWAGKLGMPALAQALQINPQPTEDEARFELEQAKAGTQAQIEGTRMLHDRAQCEVKMDHEATMKGAEMEHKAKLEAAKPKKAA